MDRSALLHTRGFVDHLARIAQPYRLSVCIFPVFQCANVASVLPSRKMARDGSASIAHGCCSRQLSSPAACALKSPDAGGGFLYRDEVDAVNDNPQKRGCQFGLLTVILAMLVLSVVFALLFAGPSWMTSTTASVVAVFWAVGLAALAVRGRGDVKAFCMGAVILATIAAIPTSCLLIAAAAEATMDDLSRAYRLLDRGGNELRLMILFWVTISCFFGMLSLIGRRRLSRDE